MFIRNRLAEAAGLALLCVAAVLGLALLSFNPADPSLNSAVDGPVNNLLGTSGAIAADLLLQTVGLAIVPVVLAFAVWGWRSLTLRPPRRLPLRLLALLLCVASAAVALGMLTVPGWWPLDAGLGGVFGHLLGHHVRIVAARLGAADLATVPAAFVAALAVVFGYLALGLRYSDWRQMAGAASRTAGQGGRALRWGWARVKTVRLPERAEPVFERPRRGEGPGGDAPGTARPRKRESVVDPAPPRTKPGRRAEETRQRSLDLGSGDDYAFPPLDLLRAPPSEASRMMGRDALEQNARLLEGVLADFGVQGEIVKVRPGPVVTLYELAPAPGTKTSRVIGLADDIARSMSAVSVRVAVVTGRNVIGIELPNAHRETVYLQEMLASEAFERHSGKLTLALGKDIGGQAFMADLARMPHLLIAGTTGSGKSVAINTMILSLLYQFRPEACKLILVDPKMLELSAYDGIPHLLCPVVTEPGKAIVALKWAVREMEDRYRAMSALGVRNIDGYNKRIADAKRTGEVLTRHVQTGFDPETGKPTFEDQPLPSEPMPFIVVVVDEMADLMMVAGKDIEAAVQRLAQMARAAGIHLIMATQRPSVDVITGTIKANFPTRISFQVTSKIDSRTILGEPGAEQLLGQGDMLYMAGGGRITRVHGPFVTDNEVETVVRHLRGQGEPNYLEAVTEEEEEDGDGPGFEDRQAGADPLYDEAVALVAREGKASTSFIQRYLQIGYNRAARIIEQMEADGVVSKANRVGRREVLVGNGGHDDQ